MAETKASIKAPATVVYVCLLLVFVLYRPWPPTAMALLRMKMSPDRFAGLTVGDPPWPEISARTADAARWQQTYR